MKSKSEPQMLPVFGGYWLPSGAALGYAYILNRWQTEMADTLATGVDPFKATSMLPAAGFTVLYLSVLLITKKLLKDRPAYDCKPYMAVYNLYQVILNCWCVGVLCQEVAGFGMAKGMSFWGNTFDPTMSGFRVGFAVWVHYNNKFVELLDTAWMLLRKKDRQVSFLHGYHHVMMMWAWLYVCKIECGGDAWFGAAMNSFVHIVMYSYYFLSQIGIPCPWKKYLTMMQMIQFCVCMAHSAYVVWAGNSPILMPLLQGFVMINMLVLFGQFYRKAYVAKEKGNGKAVKTA